MKCLPLITTYLVRVKDVGYRKIAKTFTRNTYSVHIYGERYSNSSSFTRKEGNGSILLCLFLSMMGIYGGE